MVWDWISREAYLLPFWWLLVSLAGATVLPLCIRLCRALPDKGYLLARTIGVLLIAFVYWLLASFGFVQNNTGGMILAWLLVLGFSLFVYFRSDETFSWSSYWRENRSVIPVGEILFIVLFASLMTYRAFQNDTSYTEKPMELTFLSGIMRSESFPPNDAWLSGYSISYYHFGYIMAAMLSMLSGVTSGTGFSMTIALWFALIGLNVFAVLYNLVRSQASIGAKTPAFLTGLLGVFLVLIMGNLQTPLIEIPYISRSLPADYFNWWGTQERIIDTATNPEPFNQNPPFTISTPMTHPQDWQAMGWWWFRASRVLTDYEFSGLHSTHAQPIDEFPSFSFVLSDAHPHVLALPFVIMVIGMGLNLVLIGRAPTRPEILFYGILIGGLIFLNTWDGAIYLGAIVGAEALRRLIQSQRLSLEDWFALLVFAGQVVLVAILAYLPFLIGFRSQASGFLPNLIYPTLFRRFFIMFGLQLLILVPFLAVEAWRSRARFNLNLAIAVPLVLLLVSIAIMLALAIIGSFVPSVTTVFERYVVQYGSWGEVLQLFLQRRLAFSLTSIVLLTMIGLIVGWLFPRQVSVEAASPYSPATAYSLLLLGVGLSLLFIPDFVYLRDNFGVRINTVFKFYYQGWLTLGLASAYGFYSLVWDKQAERLTVILRAAMGLVFVLVLALGSIYPIFAFYTRGWLESPTARGDNPYLTIDGSSRMPLSETDYQAVMCLGDLVTGDDAVVAEAEQHAYRSFYGRVASITGIPIVMGWANHEGQWRGSSYAEAAGSRQDDLTRLFTDLRWDMAVEIIKRYGIDYIFFGDTERQQYGAAGEEKFQEYLEVVCDYGETRVYHVSPDTLELRD